jgi:para-nitrobenzyl esterase
MQTAIFGDMSFRSDGMSENCLYLNVWAPAKKGKSLLPVLVYFYGGGFVAGDGSEPRYDGESMATKGIVALTVNYRLGVFGFFAHPNCQKSRAKMARVIMACSTRRPPCSGCRKTLLLLAAIRPV